MRVRIERLAGLGICATVVILSGCSSREDTPRRLEARLTATTQAVNALQARFPGARIDTAGGRVSRVYGATLSTGATPGEAAERFRQDHAAALGLSPDELVRQELRQGRATASASAGPIQLMYDPATKQFKYSLYRYGQTKGGVPVFRTALLALVRNGGGNPVVWASAAVHDVSGLVARPGARARAADPDKSLRAIRGSTDFAGRPMAAPSRFVAVPAPELVVFAGTEDRDAAPKLAIEYVAEADQPMGKWRFVADADTGDVLHVENAIVFDNVSGTVTANVTDGFKAMDCAPEVPTNFGFADVNVAGGAAAIAGPTGAFVLPNGGTTAVDVVSTMGGQYFDVVNFPGANETLTQSVLPPGPASFIHNASNTDPMVVAQVNGYANSNQVRNYLLKYLPNYPTVAGQANFPVIVNRNDNFCPGNAWYDPTLVTINFCLASATFGNTSFASVNHHEFGHHIVQAGGSGQGAYGEGMGDTIAALLAGDPGLGFGFFLNQCTTSLRNADNTCQYSATLCSSCGSEVHDCGNLLSGIMWSIRKKLAVSQPTTYVDLLNSLVLSSIPMHTGTGITPQIAVDLITLDDNDGNINNGSPHYSDICAGFAEHGISCPPLLTGLSVSPAATLSAEGPAGGPFAPASIVYTVSNLGPSPTLQYQVTPAAATTWLTITNGSGQLAVGQQVQVTVSINQAGAATLAKGGYSASVQFVNQTDGSGSTTRGAQLQVGVPTPIFTETFEGGLGSFTPDTANLWHVTASCASTLSGHSLPGSLYYGLDAGCTYSNGLTNAGTATSTAIPVSDTSVVKLRFKYFLGTERSTVFDKATVQISVNDGAYTTVAGNSGIGQALQDGTGLWQSSDIDISTLVAGLPSANVRVRVGFNTVDSIANAFAGFLVDDVQLLAFAGGPACTTDAQCGDGAFCNGVEHCTAGTCTAGTPVNCGDVVTCTQDSCNEATDSCLHLPVDSLCNDGQVCNGAEVCNAASGCQAGTPLDCNDSNACTVDTCAGAGCQNTPINCDDGNPCTTDSCNTATGCVHTNNTASCADDGNTCTNDVCSAGACTHPNNTASCTDDGSMCTNDVCSAGVCTHPNNGTCGAGAFLESGGQVVIEAEHFGSTVARASHTWDVTANTSASGGQMMQSNPNNGANVNTGFATGSPQLNFSVNFATTGTYQVWVRGFGPGTADRTLHAGIDGTGPASSDRMSGFTAALAWSKSTLDGPVATVSVTSAGRHIVNIWMREDGFRLDKLVLTTSTSLIPTGAGPAESARGAICTTNANCSDTNPCTQDTCVSGLCLNAAAPAGTACADDGNTCTNDVCSGTACTHPNNTAPCADDGNACTNDVCGGGVCTHPSNGSCGATPCSSFCANPVNFSGNFQSGNLGTGATCFQNTGALNGANCGNFVSPRALFVNGTQMTCNNGNWPSVPAKVNGGYCVYTTAGNHPWAYFTTW